MRKKLIWIGFFVGSTAGSFIPVLWGADAFSMSSVLFSVMGGLVGVWAGYKLTKML